jgi:NAD+ synthase (glutamine-hydrolysing)
MGTDKSSAKTLSRTKRLGKLLGHPYSVKIDEMAEASWHQGVHHATGRAPQVSVLVCTMAEDLALENIQVRHRMVTAHLYAQLLPWVRRQSSFILVFWSSNLIPSPREV